MQFTMVVKEVRLMAQNKGIRIHQYQDDWLVIATSHQTCLHHTPVPVPIYQESGGIVSMVKSELEPKQKFWIPLGQHHVRLIQWHLKFTGGSQNP